MVVGKVRRSQCGASALEALVAVPVVLVSCLLVLQMMLLYRAKITLNFATQEAARIGAMNNGRVVPRFLTDLTQFAAVIRTKKKCISNANTSVTVAPTSNGNCPTSSTEQPVTSAGPTITENEANLGGNGAYDNGYNNGEGESKFADDRNQVRAERSASAAAPVDTDAETIAPAPAPLPSAPASAATSTSGSGGTTSAATKFFRGLGRGMMRYGDSSVLQGFIIGIAPLYTRGSANDIPQKKFYNAAKGQYHAYGDALMNSCIIYHNPTHAAFIDFGFVEIDGPDRFTWQIPNDLLRYRIPGYMDRAGKGIGYYKAEGKHLSEEDSRLRGRLSKMSVQDATLLSIEIKYSYALDVPVARDILIGIAKLAGSLSSGETALGSIFNAQSLERGRWPLSSFATYRMQTPVHWHTFYPFGQLSMAESAPALSEPFFKVVKELYDKIREKVNNDFDLAQPQAGFCPGLMYDALEAGSKNWGTAATNWIGKDYDQNR